MLLQQFFLLCFDEINSFINLKDLREGFDSFGDSI